jgi:hypothetical protein
MESPYDHKQSPIGIRDRPGNQVHSTSPHRLLGTARRNLEGKLNRRLGRIAVHDLVAFLIEHVDHRTASAMPPRFSGLQPSCTGLADHLYDSIDPFQGPTFRPLLPSFDPRPGLREVRRGHHQTHRHYQHGDPEPQEHPKKEAFHPSTLL